MCGIYGYNWFDKLLADELGRLLRHRGPDESGLVEVSSGTIGVRRLSIIDRAGGRQPMASPDSTLVIAYNGEVYNYRDLMNRLARLGHRFATQSDTEVVLHAYEEWGESGLSKLNGMFAFAVVDRNTDSWFLARDPFGIKPLYYSNDGKKFAFASEIAPLLLMPWVGRVARSNLLTRFIAAGILPEDRPETLFMDVYKVRPGHILTFQDGKLETKRFLPKWTVKPAQTKNIDELAKDCRAKSPQGPALVVDSILPHLWALSTNCSSRILKRQNQSDRVNMYFRRYTGRPPLTRRSGLIWW